MNNTTEGIFKNTKGARMMQGEKLTNFERIKSMSVDELAEFLENEDRLLEYCKPKYCKHYESDGSCKAIREGDTECCVKAAKNWLESEVEDETREETNGKPEEVN